MLRCRVILTCGTASLTLVAAGCDGPTVERNTKAIGEAVGQAAFEHQYPDVQRRHGSQILASIVGSSVPAGGPAALTGLSTDIGWRAFYRREVGKLKPPLRVPYPLDFRRPGDSAGFCPPDAPAEPGAAADGPRL